MTSERVDAGHTASAKEGPKIESLQQSLTVSVSRAPLSIQQSLKRRQWYTCNSGSNSLQCPQTFVIPLLRDGTSVNYLQKKRSKSGAQEERYPAQNAEGSNSSAIKNCRVAHAFVGDALVFVQMAVSQLAKEQGTYDLVLSTGSNCDAWSWSRFVLADTEQLHRKIGDMGQRIRQLEDALTIFQSGVSSETHPLLREELLGIKFGPEVHTGQSTETDPHNDPVKDTMDALGTLSIGDGGASKYFGRSAGSEVSVPP